MTTIYQAYPKKSHKKAVKHVLRYVNCNVDHGIFYKTLQHILLVIMMLIGLEIARTERACKKDDSMFGNNLVSHYSKRQNCIFLSIVEAE